ncbi:uncharacterized protein PADG_11257 [Paracoccidioides brasiliensis Pb18]|uniref:Uncharacterized protein n=2 Tax=Paracoccidioides brasiliensis TaxID=121759 RepID=A0A0A0HWI8_PARBD|nr:uncharacterized protein PADG_11257 [Paracoccidioides brasiliensis Pb18]KGM92441.1 hypothetical protein PADG_11257 [Paracoccidioides brasiliensis Pb18]ODH28280.1 hypothetical protein ACO22_03966 [Paracoccidioides brasiliensis]ODH52314.1 hypothetical protein GX48_01632 [Paracoccidioides brasiliensis]
MGKVPNRSIPHHSLQSLWIPGFLDEHHSYVGWDPYQHPQKQTRDLPSQLELHLTSQKVGPKTDQLGKNDQSKLTRLRRANHGSDISLVLPVCGQGPSVES